MEFELDIHLIVLRVELKVSNQKPVSCCRPHWSNENSGPAERAFVVMSRSTACCTKGCTILGKICAAFKTRTTCWSNGSLRGATYSILVSDSVSYTSFMALSNLYLWAAKRIRWRSSHNTCSLESQAMLCTEWTLPWSPHDHASQVADHV